MANNAQQHLFNINAEPSSRKSNFRPTPELIFAFVEPLGGGAQSAAIRLEKFLREDYGYEDVHMIVLSALIQKIAEVRSFASLHYTSC